ncbi:signal transduction histidine kinase [Sedimentibacter acidaminivorans]|uniref:Signal transduction histidine kinase n=1 Tax=Sedimentibacter acidaminivorans TaxID=913099 RepID=A0ABS4GCP5_9FIRM|nr:sensor histidine kinase [Sedimentibacter acidaminivorans]MBP1925462.1 signal transduction histidine kinase [Sedimentibacter acidaminivorans]
MKIAYEFSMLCTYIFEALIVNLLFAVVFIKKYGNIKHYTILFSSYGTITIIHTFNSTLLNLSAFIIFTFFISLILYEGKFSKKVYYTMFLILIMTVTEVIALFILKILFKNLTLSMQEIIILAIISKTMMFLLVKSFCNNLNKNTNKIPEDKFLALLLISATIVTVLYMFISITSNIKIDTNKSIAALISAIGLMFSSMLIFYIFEQSIKEQTNLKEFALLKQKSELDMKHYKILKENYDNVKIIEHDIKKHIRLIDEFAKIGNNLEIIKYIENFNEDMQYFSLKPISKNKALDIVLNEKMQIAQNKDIKFTFHIQNVNLEFINDIDICTIFSNILDNALESCEKSENKEIILEIYMVNGKFITIELANSCYIDPVIQDGELITSKFNLSDHGFGMKSIVKTVKKYKGQVFYFYNNEELKFITNISIPV